MLKNGPIMLYSNAVDYADKNIVLYACL